MCRIMDWSNTVGGEMCQLDRSKGIVWIGVDYSWLAPRLWAICCEGILSSERGFCCFLRLLVRAAASQCFLLVLPSIDGGSRYIACMEEWYTCCVLLSDSCFES